MTDKSLLKIYDRLLKRYGPQSWWPAETPFEVMVGAILTQRASWSNVERAIENLKNAGLLSIKALAHADKRTVRNEVKPSGFYKVKTERMLNLARYLDENYRDLDEFFVNDISTMRRELLALKGIGKETADSMILYAANKPIFVVDAYTRRLCERLPVRVASLGYDDIQDHFQRSLPENVALYKELHALIVVHCKETCKAKPSCQECLFFGSCHFSKRESRAKN